MKKEGRCEFRIDEEELQLIEKYCKMNELKFSQLVRSLLLEHITNEISTYTKRDLSESKVDEKMGLLIQHATIFSRNNLLRKYEQHMDTQRFRSDPYKQVGLWMEEKSCVNCGFEDSKIALDWLKSEHVRNNVNVKMDRKEKLRKYGYLFSRVIYFYRKIAIEIEKKDLPSHYKEYDGIRTLPCIHDLFERTPLAFSGFEDLNELVLFIDDFLPFTKDEFNKEYLINIGHMNMPEKFVIEYRQLNVDGMEGKVTFESMEKTRDLFYRIVNDVETRVFFKNTVMVSDWFDHHNGLYDDFWN